MAPRTNHSGARRSTRASERQIAVAASSANAPSAQANAAALPSSVPSETVEAALAVPPRAVPEDPPPAIESASSTVALSTATPRTAKLSSFNFNHKKKGYYTRILNEEMQKAYAQVGVEDFFRLCMSGPRTKSLQDVFTTRLEGLENTLDFDDVPLTGKEALMYAPLCKTTHTLLRKLHVKYENKNVLQSQLFIKETADVKEKKAPEVDLMPDLSLFDANIPAAVRSFDDNTKDTKKKKTTAKAQDGTRESFSGRTSWAWTTAFIEAKNDPLWELFDREEDPGDFSRGVSMTRGDADVHVTAPGLKSEALGRRSRSQIIKYVSEIQLRQHRNFVFCAHICQGWVRFMRWDRTGAIVSKAVNYRKFPLALLEFICRLATADGVGQGYDTSARLVHEPRRTLNAFADDKKGQWEFPYIQDMVIDLDGFPVYEITCPGINAPGLDEPLTLWVGRYWSGSRSPTGRGSKAYIAFDEKNQRLVFLKDYWCAQHPTVHQELETYERFRTAETPPAYVAHCLGGGTVRINGVEQVTMTQRLLEMIWLSSPTPLERVHCRLVLQEIGRPLETFEDSHQLVLVLYKVFLAHEQAWRGAGVLHRDISPDNILIDLNGDALLIDWDLCKYKEDLGWPASQHGRSGTWPFMSLALLQYPRKPNELADDLESFIYVLCFMALCFLKHDLSTPKDQDPSNLALSQFLKAFFFEARTRGTYCVGGTFKESHARKENPGFTLDNQTSQVAHLIKNFWALLGQHCKAVDWKKMEREWSSTPSGSPIMVAASNPPTAELAALNIKDPYSDQDRLYRPAAAPASRASQSAETSSQVSTIPPSPLSSHAIMKEFFVEAVRIPPCPRDKTPDQFSNLPDPDAPPGVRLMSSSSREVSRSSFGL